MSGLVYMRFELLRAFRNRRFFIFSFGFPLVLYFLIAGVLPRLRYLRLGLAAILVFVGGKMLAADLIEIPIGWSLLAILAAIGVATVASLIRDRRPA